MTTLRNPVDGSTVEVNPKDIDRLDRLTAIGYRIVGDIGIVGNKGPEMVTLPKGARVIPAKKRPAKK